MQEAECKTADTEMTAGAKSEEDLILEAIEELRPTLRRDGGDIKLHKIEGDMVVIEMTGACVGCVLASVTVAGVRKMICDKVGRPMRVIPRSAFIPLERMKRTRGVHPAGRSIQISEAKPKAEVPA